MIYGILISNKMAPLTRTYFSGSTVYPKYRNAFMGRLTPILRPGGNAPDAVLRKYTSQEAATAQLMGLPQLQGLCEQLEKME